MSSLPTRFTAPAPSDKSITRYSLIRQLECVSCRSIVFIHAPAGYGKTTLVNGWLVKTGRTAVWLSLDEYSATAAGIYRDILRCLACHIDESDNSTMSLEDFLGVLSEHKEWPHTLVIDDFHLCADVNITSALPMIRARLPCDTAFVVMSRNPPHEILADQIVKGMIKQITDLQFKPSEIKELFAKNNVPISKQQAEVLKHQTDGWAAALSAILMSGNYIPYCGPLDQNTLNHYLKSNIFEFYNDFDILKKCSVCDVLYPSLCKAVTNSSHAWDIIVKLANRTGLVTRLTEKSYRLHALLREFLLQELENDTSVDKTEIYIDAANWFMSNGDSFRALHMAAKSGDILKMEELRRSLWREYGSDNMDTDAYVRYIDEYLLSIPNHISSQYPLISIQCFHGAVNCRPIAEVHYWLNILEVHMNERRFHTDDYLSAAFMLAIDPRESSWHVPKQFEKLSGLITNPEPKNPRAFSLSQNLPFFHKAQRDYTDIATELPAFLEEIEKQMKPFLGSVFSPLAMLCEAGIYYETGELERGERVAAEVVRATRNHSPEIRFCAYALYDEILRLRGKPFELKSIVDMITETKSKYLMANFSAYEFDVLIYNGDKEAAARWLERYKVDDVIMLYKIARYLTTVRATITIGKFSDAINLSERLAEFAQDFNRNADYVEAMTLQAICYWNMFGQDKAVKLMIDTIVKATALQITTPISKYGNDVAPILRKITNRLKYGYDTDILDKSFVNRLYIYAKTVSSHIRGMLSRDKPKVIRLSARQKEILMYLTQNLTYQEISDRTGVKITTVRDHITKLYEKLEVTTAMGAVMKAEELSL